MQGRGDLDRWTKTLKVAYSLNGRTWSYVDEGAIFQANSDRNSKVPIVFANPVFATTIRLYPQTWHGNNPSLRF